MILHNAGEYGAVRSGTSVAPALGAWRKYRSRVRHNNTGNKNNNNMHLPLGADTNPITVAIHYYSLDTLQVPTRKFLPIQPPRTICSRNNFPANTPSMILYDDDH